MRILIVEDNEDESDQYRELVEAAWDDAEIDQVFNEAQAKTALARIDDAGEAYDLITLDIDLSLDDPEAVDQNGGFRILNEMRPGLRSTVIVVSGRKLESETVGFMKALKIVDTLTKPHRPADYLRAVRLGLELQNKAPSKPILDGMTTVLGNLSLSPLTGNSSWRGKPLKCTLTQMRILALLAKNAPKPVSVAKLKKALTAINPTPEAVTVHISALRKALREIADDPKNLPLKNVRGGGSYFWIDD